MSLESIQTHNLYGNILVYSPYNQPMFRCGQKKANWYLSRGLAEVVSKNPTVLKLTFEPKGLGHTQLYYLSERENICVVCGSAKNLTKHHIVPYCFRRYLPQEYKSKNHYDVHLVCVDCHNAYETKACQFKQDLLEEAGLEEVVNKPSGEQIRLRKASRALLEYRHSIPEERISDLEDVIKSSGYATDSNSLVRVLEETQSTPVAYSPYAEYVNQIRDLHGFIIRWREHFVKYCNPKHLPKGWLIYRNGRGY